MCALYKYVKHNSTNRSTEIKNKERFETNAIWKYTATIHIRIAKAKEVILLSLSATSLDQIIDASVFSAPPPSSMDIGYKFIMASEMLATTKNVHVSPPNGKIDARRADVKLKIMPPNWTINSLL